MAACVLDASAVLATLLEEPGGTAVEGWLRGACISTVNLSEVVAKLVERGTPGDVVARTIEALDLDVRPFDQEQAHQAGLLRAVTRGSGLSLGDRACLALAAHLNRPAVTTDRAWAQVDTGVTVELVR